MNRINHFCLVFAYFSDIYIPVKVFNLDFYGPVNTVMVMSSQPVNLLTLFLGRLSPVSG